MLAIIIPYYKLTFFKATLQSLANQIDQRFKVYIGNDASPENPLELLQNFQDKFDFQYKEFDTNLGSISLVKQWERCIEMIDNEDWIMILGDDDVLSDNFVFNFYNNFDNFDKKKISVVRMATYRIDNFGNKISKIYFHPKIEKSSDFIFRKSRSSLSEYVFKINKINEIKFKNFPLAWFSDILGVLEFSDFGNVYSINNAFVKIRISNQSISGQTTNSSLKEKANFMFYEYLINKKINLFSESQKNLIFEKMNLRFNNDKRNFNVFLKINIIYIKIGSILGLLNFYKSIVESLINKYK